jgi:hypothetical protein
MNEANEYLDERYAGREGWRRFVEIAGDFDFGRNLPRAAFPAAFVASLVALAEREPVDFDSDRTYFVVDFSGRRTVCMYDGFFTPDFIRSQNGIIAESMYAEQGAVIMPPGHYAVGSAYDDRGELRIMICLDQASKQYGHLFLWRLAHDALGTGDNTGGLAFVSTSMEQLYSMLAARAEAEAAARVAPDDLLRGAGSA